MAKIYLIGGIPRSGKTTVAKKLAADLKISWVSADALESVAKRFTPKNQQKKKFPKDILRKATHNSNDEMYSTYSAEKIKKAYITQAKASWKMIETFVECLLGEGIDYIIEGHQIAPALAAKLQKQYGKNIRIVFMNRHDVESIVAAARRGTAHDDWFVKKTKDPDTHYKIALMLSRYGDYLRAEAVKYSFRSFNMDNNFAAQIKKVLKFLE